MVITVKPALSLKGRVALPASKSYSIRAFIIAACGGTSSIINPSNCADAKVAMSAARFLGARLRVVPVSSGAQWRISAGNGPSRCARINVKESGTVLRFLLPLLALYGAKVTVTGEGTLRGRPNLFLIRALRSVGIDIFGNGKSHGIPIRLRRGVLKGGTIAIEGGMSSQFISAFLIACPRLSQDTRLVLRGKRLVSTEYVTMTRQILARSGIQVNQLSKRQFYIKGNQAFRGLKRFIVPSDYGLAAFLIAAAVLVKSDIVLTGYLSEALIQADGQIIPLLERMGVRLRRTAKLIHVKGPYPLRGGNFSLKDCPDLVPIMATLALFAKGETRFFNIGHARDKESDRISDLKNELVKIGAKATEKRDALTIVPAAHYKRDCLLDPHNDHRLAMSFCVLGLKLGVRVKDIECTRKSYPDFTRDFIALGASVRRSYNL